MTGEAPDIREQDCPDHTACNGWCDQHQVLSDEDVRRLRVLLERIRDRHTNGSGEVLDFVQAVIRARLQKGRGGADDG